MRGKTVRIVGCAKGAGMIHPNMATMLSFVMTDAAIEPAALDVALRDVVSRTFNAITVDGDSSTNDTLLVLANGASGAKKITEASGADYTKFVAALEEDVCKSLAIGIVEDGEGATHLVEVEVRGAPERRRRETGRANDRAVRARQDGDCRRRSQLGPHPGRGRSLRRAV